MYTFFDMEGRRLLNGLVVLLWLLVLLHGIGLYFNLYWLWPWFDIVTHFIGGLWLGLFSLWFVFYSGYVKPASARYTPFYALVIVTASIGVIAVVWELYKYLGNTLLGIPFPVNYIGDSILDMIMGLVGAFTGYWYFRRIDKPTIRRAEYPMP